MARNKNLDFKEVQKFIRASSKESSVYLGCDSRRFKRKGLWYASYARVVCIHKDSNKGCKIFSEIITERDYGSIKQRLLREVALVLELYDSVHESVGKRNLEIHLDINTDPKHKSNAAYGEAKGYVKGVTGIEPNFKPIAAAASFAADAKVNGTLH